MIFRMIKYTSVLLYILLLAVGARTCKTRWMVNLRGSRVLLRPKLVQVLYVQVRER